MKNILDDQEVNIPCSGCKKEHSKTIKFLKQSPTFKCSCGVDINIDGAELKKKINNIEKQLKNLFK